MGRDIMTIPLPKGQPLGWPVAVYDMFMAWNHLRKDIHEAYDR